MTAIIAACGVGTAVVATIVGATWKLAAHLGRLELRLTRVELRLNDAINGREQGK